MVGWLVDWLEGRLVVKKVDWLGWLVDWVTWLVDWVGWLVDWLNW